MHRHLRGWSVATVLIGAAAAVLLTLPAQAQTQAAIPGFVHEGQAWGSKAQVGSLILSTPSAAASVGGCNANTGVSAHKTALAVDEPGLLGSGAVDSRVETGTSVAGTFTRSTATIANVNVLGGQITATSLKAMSEVRYTAGTGFTFKNGSTFTNLTINGQATTASAPNARHELPGVGYVVVNEQKRTVKATFGSQEVNLLHVHVTNASNPFGLKVGTDITVGHAVAGLSTPLPVGGLVAGTASGVYYREGSLVKIGQSPHASIPCLGGSSSATVASANAQNTMATSTLKVTAQGTLGATKTVGHTTSTVQSVNLLNGVVTATGVKAVAHGEFNGSSYSFNSNGSTFASLNVNGSPVNPTLNAVVQIQDVGKLYLYRVTKGSKSISVRMLELVLDAGNSAGLPAGTTYRVAMANVNFP